MRIPTDRASFHILGGGAQCGPLRYLTQTPEIE